MALKRLRLVSSLDFIPKIMNKRQFGSLMKNKAYVNGQWVSAENGKTFNVINPSNGEIIGEVADCNSADTLKAIQAARTAFETWRNTTNKERSKYLRKLFELQTKYQDDLAKILTLEMGKPLKEAETEIIYGSSFWEWFSEEARRIYGDVVPSPVSSKEMLFLRQPIGVAGLITPWNFPNAMITRKAGAALATGCTIIIKPSEDTPYSALAIAQLADEAGLPPGVLNVLPVSRKHTADVGETLCKSTLVDTISFTGSTAVGKILLEQAASTVKRMSMELGGNAAFIVFKSANIDKAISGVMASKFRCSGQTCVCTNRILVHEDVYNEFIKKLSLAMTKELKVGDGFDPETTLGPLINSKGVVKVEEHIKDAASKGAKIILGGKSLGGNFVEPTLISEVKPNMLVCTEETFGPLAAVIKFKTEEEAISIANSTRLGLAGYFYTEDISQAWRVAKKLEVGMVGINEGLISAAEGAFGGIKESGLGREGSHYGVDEFINIKYVCFGGLN